MGWIKKEAKAFGKEAVRQGCLLVFGKAPHSKPPRKQSKLERDFQNVKTWARRNGFNK